MKTLKCEQCDKTIGKDDWGLKFDDLYFCSNECLNEYVDLGTYPITYVDVERDGEDDEDEVKAVMQEIHDHYIDQI